MQDIMAEIMQRTKI